MLLPLPQVLWPGRTLVSPLPWVALGVRPGTCSAQPRGLPLPTARCRAQPVLLLPFAAPPSCALGTLSPFFALLDSTSPHFPWHQSMPTDTRLSSCREVCNPADVQINGFAINIPVNEVSTLKSLLLKKYFLNKQKKKNYEKPSGIVNPSVWCVPCLLFSHNTSRSQTSCPT